MNGTARMELALLQRIERVQQCEDPLRLVPRSARDRLSRRQRVRRSAASRPGRCREQAAARIRCDLGHAPGQHIRERGEVRHRRRLAAVERVLDGAAPSAGREIDEVGHVARGDLQAQRVTFERRSVEELRARPHRCHGRHFVDDNTGWGIAAHNRQQRDGGIVTTRFAGFGYAAVRHEIKDGVAVRAFGANFKAAIIVGLGLVELLGCAGTGFPQSHG